MAVMHYILLLFFCASGAVAKQVDAVGLSIKHNEGYVAIGEKLDIKIAREKNGDLNIKAPTVRFNQKTLDELISAKVKAALGKTGGKPNQGNTGDLAAQVKQLQTQLAGMECATKNDGSKVGKLTCYGGVAYAVYDTDSNKGNTFQVKSLADIRSRCASLGLKAVRIQSAKQIHLHLRPLVQTAGYDLKKGVGIPLAYDQGLNNDYQALDDTSVHVQHILNTLRQSWGYTGDYHTDQRKDKQYLAGFGWGKSQTNVGPEDWGFQHQLQALICSNNAPVQEITQKGLCDNVEDGLKVTTSSTTVTCYAGVAYAVYDTDSNKANTFQVKDLNQLRSRCASLGLKAVRIQSAMQVHNHLRPLVQTAGYDLKKGVGIPLAYDHGLNNDYQALDDTSVHVQHILLTLRTQWGYTGDYHTDQRKDKQYLAGFGWGKSTTNVGIEDWGFQHQLQALICSDNVPMRPARKVCKNVMDGGRATRGKTAVTCYAGVAYALYDTDSNKANTFQVKDLNQLRSRCASLGLKAVRIRSAMQVHNHLRPLVQTAGYDLKKGAGIPLGYDQGLNNDYQALDDTSVHVQKIFNTLRKSWGYTGDYHTDQRKDKQYLAGFGWGKSQTNVGPEDYGFHHQLQALICSDNAPIQPPFRACENVPDGRETVRGSTTVTCYGGVAYALYDTDGNVGTTFQVKDLNDLRSKCTSLGLKAVRIRSAKQIHLHLRKIVQKAGYDLKKGAGIPLGYDEGLNNDYQALDDTTVHVQKIFNELRTQYGYTGDYHTDQRKDKQYLAGFGWGKSETNVGPEDWGFQHQLQTLICSDNLVPKKQPICEGIYNHMQVKTDFATVTCYGGVAYAVYDTDTNRGNTFQVKDIHDLRERCAGLGLEAVRMNSPYQVHNFLRPLVQNIGYNLRKGVGIPLAYDHGLNNDFQALDDTTVHVQGILNTLRSNWGYTGDYHTDQRKDKQYLSGFGWGKSDLNVGPEDWGFQHQLQALICSDNYY